jgi:hypothetical protein
LQKLIIWEDAAMLAEKFILLIETLRSQNRLETSGNQTWRDGSQRVASASPHVAVELPGARK